MNKTTILSIFIGLSMLLASCSGFAANPQTELLGNWYLIDNNEGNNLYAHDLSFLEDGTLIIQNFIQDQIDYSVIAPGRMKITNNEESEVVQFDRRENELILIVGDETNHYTLVNPGVSMTPPQNKPETQTNQTISTEAPTETIEPSPTITSIPNTPTVTSALAIGTSKLREVDGMLVMYVPAGSFIMGSADNDPNAYAHEKPQHVVSVDAFWMDAYEISNEMFHQFVEETGYQTQAEKQGFSYMYNSQGAFGKFSGVNWQHPLGTNTFYQDSIAVTHVNQFDARAYCSWAGGRLPTEAEWEYAARGEDQRIYPWGNQIDPSLLHFDSRSGPTAVSNFPGGASPFGILNMAGNVFEWTSDWYAEDYYTYSTQTNPEGPSVGEFCVVRGGAWTNSAKHVRTTHRDISKPELMNHLLGFRCVMEP